ncbi:hypothetical protein BESB_060710 [Besnoitia besnoiti]|uniref:Uncharacterized protein n=1 Tax=Besnoitia besnoiti TaxID=94643 RepID=A0A2A9MD98_BESBE|nr:hypothetical protein BESB_060710 [Besnoitia besnoiti]PFH35184.1 hypothetical protein BESB_060710 [Besnoitia besnoiti]
MGVIMPPSTRHLLRRTAAFLGLAYFTVFVTTSCPQGEALSLPSPAPRFSPSPNRVGPLVLSPRAPRVGSIRSRARSGDRYTSEETTDFRHASSPLSANESQSVRAEEESFLRTSRLRAPAAAGEGELISFAEGAESDGAVATAAAAKSFSFSERLVGKPAEENTSGRAEEEKGSSREASASTAAPAERPQAVFLDDPKPRAFGIFHRVVSPSVSFHSRPLSPLISLLSPLHFLRALWAPTQFTAISADDADDKKTEEDEEADDEKPDEKDEAADKTGRSAAASAPEAKAAQPPHRLPAAFSVLLQEEGSGAPRVGAEKSFGFAATTTTTYSAPKTSSPSSGAAGKAVSKAEAVELEDERRVDADDDAARSSESEKEARQTGEESAAAAAQSEAETEKAEKKEKTEKGGEMKTELQEEETAEKAGEFNSEQAVAEKTEKADESKSEQGAEEKTAKGGEAKAEQPEEKSEKAEKGGESKAEQPEEKSEKAEKGGESKAEQPEEKSEKAEKGGESTAEQSEEKSEKAEKGGESKAEQPEEKSEKAEKGGESKAEQPEEKSEKAEKGGESKADQGKERVEESSAEVPDSPKASKMDLAVETGNSGESKDGVQPTAVSSPPKGAETGTTPSWEAKKKGDGGESRLENGSSSEDTSQVSAEEEAGGQQVKPHEPEDKETQKTATGHRRTATKDAKQASHPEASEDSSAKAAAEAAIPLKAGSGEGSQAKQSGVVTFTFCLRGHGECTPDEPETLGRISVYVDESLQLDMRDHDDWTLVGKAMNKWLKHHYFDGSEGKAFGWANALRGCVLDWAEPIGAFTPKWIMMKKKGYKPKKRQREMFLDFYTEDQKTGHRIASLVNCFHFLTSIDYFFVTSTKSVSSEVKRKRHSAHALILKSSADLDYDAFLEERRELADNLHPPPPAKRQPVKRQPEKSAPEWSALSLAFSMVQKRRSRAALATKLESSVRAA